MTLKNNRAPLLCYFKLYASFRSHRWIQAGVTVLKRPIWVKIDFLSRVTLQFDVWPWKIIGYLFYAHAVSANRILWVYAGFWWYHGILVVHLQDSVGAFWAIKDQDTSIHGLSVDNVMTDGLSRVCIWWCIMLSLITKITGIYFVGEKC